MSPITRFRDEYSFLSNFHPCKIAWEGEFYPSVEHAYQASKTTKLAERHQFTKITAKAAKRLGSKLKLRPDWESVKLGIMYKLLAQKFSDSYYALLLSSTGDAELIEGNNWGDNFWGVCGEHGQNHLGKLLMKVRDQRK